MDAQHRNPTIVELARAASLGDRAAGADLVLSYCAEAITKLCTYGKAAALSKKLAGLKGVRHDEVIEGFMLFVVEKRIRVIADMVLNQGCEDSESLGRIVFAGSSIYRACIDYTRAEKARMRRTTGYTPNTVSFSALEDAGRGGGSSVTGEDEANPGVEIPEGNPFAARRGAGKSGLSGAAPEVVDTTGVDEEDEQTGTDGAGYAQSAPAGPSASLSLDALIRAAEPGEVRACCIAFLNDERPCEAGDFEGLVTQDEQFLRRLEQFRNGRVKLTQEREQRRNNASRREQKLLDEIERLRDTGRDVPEEMTRKLAEAHNRVEEIVKRGVRRVGEGDIADLFGLDRTAGRNLLKRAKRHMQQFVEENL